jgi:hypothetical protein
LAIAIVYFPKREERERKGISQSSFFVPAMLLVYRLLLHPCFKNQTNISRPHIPNSSLIKAEARPMSNSLAKSGRKIGCEFCEFVDDNFSDMEEVDERFYRAHLRLHHGMHV